MAESTQIPKIPETETQPKIPVPTPEALGFKQTEMLDVFKTSQSGDARTKLQEIGHTNVLNKTIDNITERKDKWEQNISNIARVGADPKKRRMAVDELKKYEDSIRGKAEQSEDDADILKVLDYTRSFIGNFGNADMMRVLLNRGGSDRMQDSIARVSDKILIDNQPVDPSGIGLRDVVGNVLELSRHRYAQEHGGNAYRTADQKAYIAEAKQRLSKLRVT